MTLHINLVTTTVSDVKHQIWIHEGILAANQRLLFDQTELEEGALADYEVKPATTLHLLLHDSGPRLWDGCYALACAP